MSENKWHNVIYKCQGSPEHTKLTEAFPTGLCNLKTCCLLPRVHIPRQSLSIFLSHLYSHKNQKLYQSHGISQFEIITKGKKLEDHSGYLCVILLANPFSAFCYVSSWLPQFDTADRWHIKYIHTLFFTVNLFLSCQKAMEADWVGYTEHILILISCTIREWGSCAWDWIWADFARFCFCSFPVPFLRRNMGDRRVKPQSWVTRFSGPSAYWEPVSRAGPSVLLNHQISLWEEGFRDTATKAAH